MPQKKLYEFEAFGMHFQIPLLAVYALSAILVVGVGVFTYRKVWMDPDRELLTQKQVNAQMAAEIDEYGRHTFEDPAQHEAFEDADGKIVVRIFKDHCILIQQSSLLSGTKTKLIMSLTRKLASVARPATPLGLHLVEPLQAAVQNPACQRGCLNPHPGAFSWRYGAQLPNGWVEVWRTWPEGCQHVQLYQPQTGAWDSNPDGSPRVRWVCCTH